MRRLVVMAMIFWAMPSQAQTSLGWHYGHNQITDRSWTQFALGQKFKFSQFRLSLATGLVSNEDEMGLGDSSIAGQWLFNKKLLGQWWDIRYKLKLPTADEEKGLGTGSVDQELRLQSLMRLPYKSLAWYFVGYKKRGNSDQYQLENSWLLGAGISHKQWSVGYDFKQQSQTQLDHRHSLTVFYQAKFVEQGRKYKVSPYLSKEYDSYLSAGVSLSF